jgi:hypothetical protein
VIVIESKAQAAAGSAAQAWAAREKEEPAKRSKREGRAAAAFRQMGKYMRSKCRGAAGEEVAAVEVTQVVGVRTRSRSAAATGGGVAKVAPRRKKALAPANVAAGEPAAVGAGGDGGSCYIHLRSRMLFMAPPQPQPSLPTPAEAAGAGQQGAALAAGLSRCSSTASSVDVGGHQRRSHACRSDAAEVTERKP